MPKLHWFEVEELAAVALGLSEDADSETVEKAIYEKLDVSFEQFQKVIEAVIEFTPTAQAAVSGNFFRGFISPQGNFIIKVPLQKK